MTRSLDRRITGTRKQVGLQAALGVSSCEASFLQQDAVQQQHFELSGNQSPAWQYRHLQCSHPAEGPDWANQLTFAEPLMCCVLSWLQPLGSGASTASAAVSCLKNSICLRDLSRCTTRKPCSWQGTNQGGNGSSAIVKASAMHAPLCTGETTDLGEPRPKTRFRDQEWEQAAKQGPFQEGWR